MSTTIAIAHHAGGVGKTTTTLNLGAALAEVGQRVLLVDLDPQGHLSEWVGATPTADLAQALQIGTPIQAVQHFAWPPIALDLIPSHLETMSGAELALVGVVAGREQRLRRALRQVQADYDYILIDCPPSLSLLTVTALYAADRVLIPVQAQPKAYDQIGHMITTIQQVNEYRPGPPPVVEFVLCMVANTNPARAVETALRDTQGDLVYTTVIHTRVRLQEGSQYHAPVFAYSPDCDASREYRALAQEVLTRA